MRVVITLFLLFSIVQLNQAAVPNAALIRRVILLNMASYCEDRLTPKWDCKICKIVGLSDLKFNTKVHNKGSVMYAYMGNADNTIYLSIRGTVSTSMTAWIRNMQGRKASFPAIFNLKRKPQVHNGFKKAFESIKDELFKMMKDAKTYCPTCTKAVITGHSLGGAVAPFAALYASQLMGIQKENIQIISVSSPRVGNKDFVDEVMASVGEIYRIVNDADMIPHVPPQSLGYVHFPTEMWWRNKIGWKICSTTKGEDPKCSNSISFLKYKETMGDHTNLGELVEGGLGDLMKMDTTKWCIVEKAKALNVESDYDGMDTNLESSAEELEVVWKLTDLATIETSLNQEQQQQQFSSSETSGTVGVVVVVVVVVVAILAVGTVVLAFALLRKSCVERP